MIESILRRLSHFLNRLSSSKQLRPYEEMVLQAWRSTLTEEEQQTLDAQLIAADLMQRQAGDAKVCFYYPNNRGVPIFKNQEPCVHAATVSLVSCDDGEGKPMNVKLFLVNGKFFSIEFPKRPARYMQQHGMRPDALQVAAVEDHMVLS